MNVLEQVFEKVRRRPGRVVLPEADDDRIVAAAKKLETEGLAEPVWLPQSQPQDSEIEAILAIRPKTKPAIAARMLEKPLFRAGALVATGQADAMVAGVVSPTRRVIEAASMTIGLGEGISVPSSFFLMVLPDGQSFIFADCGLNVAPNADDLTGIALSSAKSADALLGQARLAMLSFSTLASGAGDSVDLVRTATDAVQAAGINVVGPVQADAALNPAIAARKGVEAERANTLIFPSLDAGNIAYKLMQELANAQALGPILQGFRRPVCDLSRGASVDDIVAATAVTLALDS